MGLGGPTEEERRERFFARVDRTLRDAGMPTSLRDAGVPAAAFEDALPDVVRLAFADPSARTNPRMPLLTEIEALLRAAFHG